VATAVEEEEADELMPSALKRRCRPAIQAFDSASKVTDTVTVTTMWQVQNDCFPSDRSTNPNIAPLPNKQTSKCAVEPHVLHIAALH